MTNSINSALILDDDDGIRQTLREICTKYFAIIHEARDVTEALKLLDEHVYDVAIIDVALSGEDAEALATMQHGSDFPEQMVRKKPGGLRLLNHLTGKHSRTQRIVVSAYGVSGMFGPATIQAGGWYFVSKNPARQFQPNVDLILFNISARSLQADRGLFHSGGNGYTPSDKRKLFCPNCQSRSVAESVQGQMLDMFFCLNCDVSFDVIRDVATGALWISTSFMEPFQAKVWKRGTGEG